MSFKEIKSHGVPTTPGTSQGVELWSQLKLPISISADLGSSWRGAVQTLSTVPTVDWVSLDLASPTRGRNLAALLAACLQDAPCLCWQE